MIVSYFYEVLQTRRESPRFRLARKIHTLESETVPDFRAEAVRLSQEHDLLYVGVTSTAVPNGASVYSGVSGRIISPFAATDQMELPLKGKGK